METITKTRNYFGRTSLLVVGLAAALAIAGFTHWQGRRQQAAATGWRQLWEDHTNAVFSAQARERELAGEGFMAADKVSWKLFYDRARARNMIEVRVKNPLQYHQASFGINFAAETEAWLKDGRQAAPQAVSVDVVFRAVAPNESPVAYVRFPAAVETHAANWWGKFLDFFRWGGFPVVEPPIDAKSVQLRFYAENAAPPDRGERSLDKSVAQVVPKTTSRR